MSKARGGPISLETKRPGRLLATGASMIPGFNRCGGKVGAARHFIGLR
ncbi:MAG: hypothetical protein LBR80_12315 [Deltaproteobacteria bacterium]|nr:hypothetical protein [Deltaproteobacteria bacterium]